MNIVYGGSFNPPTKAHLNIIKKLLDEFKNAKVILLPVGNDYKKTSLIDFKYRVDMLQLMIEPLLAKVHISDLEQKKGFKGTYHALNDLSKTYDDIHFVIGSDHLEKLKLWIEYKSLLKTYPIIVMNRNHYMTKEHAEMLFKDEDHRFIFIEFDMDISSTMIRRHIEIYKTYLTDEVYTYIKKNSLYEG
jgi:nicotinate-nucleotide adenylyltransferase